MSGGVSASGSDRVAGAVSSLLSPAVVVSLTVAAVWSSAGDVPVPQLVLCTVLPGPVRHVAATGRFTVGDGNRDRGRGYALVLSSYGLCTAMMLHHPDSPLTPVSLCMLVCAVPMGVADTATKVSVHCGCASACASLLSVAVWPVSLVLVPLVGWSRLHLGRHTPVQVLLGTAIGLAVPPVVAILWCM